MTKLQHKEHHIDNELHRHPLQKVKRMKIREQFKHTRPHTDIRGFEVERYFHHEFMILTITIIVGIYQQGPFLLIWFNFNPNVDK